MTVSKIRSLSAQIGALLFIGLLSFGCGSLSKPEDQNPSLDGSIVDLAGTNATADLTTASSGDIPLGTFCITIGTDKQCIMSPTSKRTVVNGNASFRITGMLATDDLVWLEGTVPDGATLPRVANPSDLMFTLRGLCHADNCNSIPMDHQNYPCTYYSSGTVQFHSDPPIAPFQNAALTVSTFSPNEVIASLDGTFQVPAFGCTECGGLACHGAPTFTPMKPYAPPAQQAVPVSVQLHLAF